MEEIKRRRRRRSNFVMVVCVCVCGKSVNIAVESHRVYERVYIFNIVY